MVLVRICLFGDDSTRMKQVECNNLHQPRNAHYHLFFSKKKNSFAEQFASRLILQDFLATVYFTIDRILSYLCCYSPLK